MIGGSAGQIVPAFRAAQERHKTLLVTQHSSPSNFVASKLDRAVTQKILSAAHQVIFSNDNVAGYYSDRIMFPAPAKIISNGVDLHTFQMTLPEKRNVLRARFALRREQPVLLFGGAFNDRNGLAFRSRGIPRPGPNTFSRRGRR